MEGIIKEWIIAAARLNSMKKTELAYRKTVCDHILAGKIEGSKKAVIGKYSLTAVAKLNTTIDEEALKFLWPTLGVTEKQCIKFKPTVVAKSYKTIDADSKLHTTITKKPGTPGLTLKG